MLSQRARTRIAHELDTRSVAAAVWAYRRTRGRLTRLWGRRAIVLTTTGRRSGRPRDRTGAGLPRGAGPLRGRGEPRAGPAARLVLQPAQQSAARGRALRCPPAAARRPGARTGSLRGGGDRCWPPPRTTCGTPTGPGPFPRSFVSGPSTSSTTVRPPAIWHGRLSQAARAAAGGRALTTAVVAHPAYPGAVGLATGTDPCLRHLTHRLLAETRSCARPASSTPCTAPPAPA